jgi:hypothetical protein
MRAPRREPSPKNQAKERKIRAAITEAMAKESGKLDREHNTPSNKAMQLALAKAGIKPRPSPKTQSATRDAGQQAKQVRPNNQAPIKKVKNKKPKPTKEELERNRRKAELKRKSKEAARRALAARRQVAAAETARLQAAEREAERLSTAEMFIRRIESASFAELLTCWRKHLDLVSYINRTGRKKERLELYERLVACVESEWKRRGNLLHSSDEYFDWPTTLAKRGKGEIGDVTWVTEGVLSYLGYRVGEKSALTADQRHAILRRVFNMSLPPIESPAYMDQWGRPGSAIRLQKMANSIASFTRQAKRRTSFDMSDAVSSWERDLIMLHDEYYVGKFGFGWPRL